MPVIPPGPGPTSSILSFVGTAGPHPQWGDIATWATALVALGALVAAAFAYRWQADAARDLSRQVSLQNDQLNDQREATRQQADAVSQLAEQARVQREALADQQEANAKQAEVLEAQLREMQQRAEAYERQQANEIRLTAAYWTHKVPGLRTGDGPRVHMARVVNVSHRPISNVICRILPAPGDAMRIAALAGRMLTSEPTAIALGGFSAQWVLAEPTEETKVALVRAGEGAGFVFIYEEAQYPDARITLRFTDDAGLHWQIDHDEHLGKLPNRDDW